MISQGSSGLDPRSVLPYVKAVRPSNGPMPGPGLDSAPASRPFVGSLITTYVVDVGAGLGFVSEDELNGMTLTVEELHEQAVRNLAAYVDQRQLRTPDYHDISPVLLDGNFEVSVMFLDELWDRFESRFGESSILAVAPTRDILACCPASSQSGRAQLRQLIDRVWPTGDHRRTRDLYRRVNGGWYLD